MQVDEEVAPNVGKKIILKRHRNNNVNENLTRLEQATMKKKIAQEIYYSKKPLGQSPMFKDANSKASVHQRLGDSNAVQNGMEKKTVLLNRSRFRWRPHPTEGIVTRKYRNHRHHRGRQYVRNLAQKRLELLKNSFRQNKGPIQLRRDNYLYTAAENITVQVRNQHHVQMHHSVQNSIDQDILMKIRRLQQKVNMVHHIPNIPITCIEFGYTKIGMNERFSSLP